MRATDISRANVAFEMGYRAQDPCSEVPEDEGVLGATFRDRDHFEVTAFEVIYRTLQARYTNPGAYSNPYETICCESNFRGHIYHGSKFGYNILPPQKYLFES